MLRVLLSIAVFVTSAYVGNSNEFIHPFSATIIGGISDTQEISSEVDLFSEAGFSGTYYIEVLPFHTYKKWVESDDENPFADLDELIEILNQKSVSLTVTLCPSKVGEDGVVSESLPKGKEMDSYLEYVAKVVNRYKKSVTVWQIGTSLSPRVWKDTPENYAKLLVKTVSRIRESLVSAKIALADMPISKTDGDSIGFFTKFLRALPEGTWFEYVVANAVGELSHPDENMHQELLLWDENIRTLLGGFGYDGVSFMAKINTYGGVSADLSSGIALVSEREQAFYLLKQYITAAALGYKQIFYTGGVVEKLPTNDDMPKTQESFDSLVFTPEVNDGLSHKKLAFHSAKKMISMLSGFDPDKSRVISSKQLFLVCFPKPEGLVYVTWRECCDYDYTITGLSGKRAKVTYALPRFTTGDEVGDFDNAFESFEQKVSRGILSLRLTDSPVFIELYEE